jgi:hypothetical protein
MFLHSSGASRRENALLRLGFLKIESGSACLCRRPLTQTRHAPPGAGHPRLAFFFGAKNVDGRVKPGHDGGV